ncbi:hypothetical protein, partial [Helicobacter cinaedi]
ILFDKDKDIDSTLKELTKDSTIPLTKLKEFIRITKEYCPTNNNIKNTHTESTTHTTQANTSHIHNNPTSI